MSQQELEQFVSAKSTCYWCSSIIRQVLLSPAKAAAAKDPPKVEDINTLHYECGSIFRYNDMLYERHCGTKQKIKDFFVYKIDDFLAWYMAATVFIFTFLRRTLLKWHHKLVQKQR